MYSPVTFHSNGSHWIIDDNAESSIGTFVATCSMFEFAMAQTSNQMRGTIMGLVFAMVGFGKLGSYTIFRHYMYPTAVCSTTTWYYHYSCC